MLALRTPGNAACSSRFLTSRHANPISSRHKHLYTAWCVLTRLDCAPAAHIQARRPPPPGAPSARLDASHLLLFPVTPLPPSPSSTHSQVRLCPAWNCALRCLVPSHPGTPTPCPRGPRCVFGPPGNAGNAPRPLISRHANPFRSPTPAIWRTCPFSRTRPPTCPTPRWPRWPRWPRRPRRDCPPTSATSTTTSTTTSTSSTSNNSTPQNPTRSRRYARLDALRRLHFQAHQRPYPNPHPHPQVRAPRKEADNASNYPTTLAPI